MNYIHEIQNKKALSIYSESLKPLLIVNAFINSRLLYTDR